MKIDGRYADTPDDSPFWGPGGKAGFLNSQVNLTHNAEQDGMPIRKLRAKAIEIAIEEMETDGAGMSERFTREVAYRRLRATVWLGSKVAGRWIAAMDSVRADHRRILLAIDWPRHAKSVLESGVRINTRQMVVLAAGIAALR